MLFISDPPVTFLLGPEQAYPYPYLNRWVENNFATGFRNSFPVGTNQVFFGGLRFLLKIWKFNSPLRLEVSLESETVFYVVLQYRTIWYFSMLLYKWKVFLLSSLFSFDPNSKRTTFDISFTQPFFLKRLWSLSFFSGAYTNKTYFYSDRPFKVLWPTCERGIIRSLTLRAKEPLET